MKDEYRLVVYESFSLLTGYPEEEVRKGILFDNFTSGLGDFIYQLYTDEKLLRAAADLKESIWNFKEERDIEVLYTSTFDVGVPEPKCVLRESKYVDYSDVQEGELIRSTQLLTKLADIYANEGLEVDLTKEMPDHLCIQLEFIRWLIHRQLRTRDDGFLDKQLNFLNQHILNWLPKLAEHIDKLNVPFYSCLAGLVSTFTTIDAFCLRDRINKCVK